MPRRYLHRSMVHCHISINLKVINISCINIIKNNDLIYNSFYTYQYNWSVCPFIQGNHQTTESA